MVYRLVCVITYFIYVQVYSRHLMESGDIGIVSILWEDWKIQRSEGLNSVSQSQYVAKLPFELGPGRIVRSCCAALPHD